MKEGNLVQVFCISGSSLSGCTDRSTDTGDTSHLINAEVINLVSCPILFTSVFCHHDTCELLCHRRFAFRGSSRHYQFLELILDQQ